MNQLGAILLFYKPYVLWSFAINTLLLAYNPDIIPLILTKFFLVLLLWFIIKESHARKKLVFYKNLGIGTFKLFSTLFFIDIFVSLTFILTLKVFI